MLAAAGATVSLGDGVADMPQRQDKGFWFSLQALDEAPPTAHPDRRTNKATVVAGADNAFRWARPCGVKLAWGVGVLFSPLTNKNQNSDSLKSRQWMTTPGCWRCPGRAIRTRTNSGARLGRYFSAQPPLTGKTWPTKQAAASLHR